MLYLYCIQDTVTVLHKADYAQNTAQKWRLYDKTKDEKQENRNNYLFRNEGITDIE